MGPRLWCQDRLRHRTGKSCLYLSSLAAVDQDVLRELVRRSFASGRDEPTTP